MELHRSQTLLTAYPAWMRRMALCAGTSDRDGSLKRGLRFRLEEGLGPQKSPVFTGASGEVVE